MDYSCSLIVRSYELDTYGHVNNANYLNYLEYARLEFLNNTGFPYDEFRSCGGGLYVVRIDICYIRPAFLNDELTVKTTSLSWGRVKGAVRQLILRGDEEIVDARVDFATVNAAGRPAPMPDNVRERWLVTRSG